MTDLHPDFEAAIATERGGAPTIECACGRYHFAAGWEHAAGELDRLRALAGMRPDRFVEHDDCDVVWFVEIFRLVYVVGCPCEYALRVQIILWANRHSILDYFTRRATRELEESQASSAQAAEAVATLGGKDG